MVDIHEYTEDQIEDDGYLSADNLALFVLEDVPIGMIDEVLQRAYDEVHHNYLWLADSYDTLVNIEHSNLAGAARPIVDEQWRSPFIGHSIQDAAEFVKNAPKPPKALNKVHFAVLDKTQYEKHQWLTICKIVEGEVQILPCTADMISVFFCGYDRDTWEESLGYWQNDGTPIMQ